MRLVLTLITLSLLLAGCATAPPSKPNDLCAIFQEKDDWYEAMSDSQSKWGTPMQIQMAIIKAESGFREDAEPPRTTLLGFIPWTRPSDAYGYPQAKDDTWDWYIDSTGNWGADRDDFEDAADFVGWYTDVSYRKLGIKKTDAKNQYLAYHEGHSGYAKGTYRGKDWLIRLAEKVAAQSNTYGQQLKGCQSSLDRGWSIWPF